MLFDTKIEKKDITYVKEDPKMINYLEEILNINSNYQNKVIELRETMDAVYNNTLNEDTGYQFYANSVFNYFNEASNLIYNFSEDLNRICDKFISSYESENENIILENMLEIMSKNVYFNGFLYDLNLENVNLEEDILNLKNPIVSKDMLRLYMEQVSDDNYYNEIRGRILNLNESLNNDSFKNILEESMMLNEGKRYNTRLTKDEKKLLIENSLDSSLTINKSNEIANNIINHYTNAVEYFNEMSNLNIRNTDQCIAHHLLVNSKLIECVNILSIYNETLGIYMDMTNKRNKEYTEFFNDILL